MLKIRRLGKIILITMSTQHLLAKTFLRPQEYYENPHFRGKVFTLDDFRAWYAKEFGAFTYYDDWVGFNIPYDVLVVFYQHRFDPLSKEEKALLDSMKDEDPSSYIIGVYKKLSDNDLLEEMKHELAHGLFHIDHSYRNEAVKILSDYNLSELRKEIKGTGEYCAQVIEDELQAYALTKAPEFQAKIPEELSARLSTVFDRAFGRLKTNNL